MWYYRSISRRYGKHETDLPVQRTNVVGRERIPERDIRPVGSNYSETDDVNLVLVVLFCTITIDKSEVMNH